MKNKFLNIIGLVAVAIAILFAYHTSKEKLMSAGIKTENMDTAIKAGDDFYDYAMKGAKGSKMPRGDKDQIMRYEIPTFSPEQRKNIGKLITDIESNIAVNRQINDNLLTLDHSLIRATDRLAV